MKDNCFLIFTHIKDRMADKAEEQKCARWIHLCFEFAADVSSLTGYKMLFLRAAQLRRSPLEFAYDHRRGTADSCFRRQTSRAAREELAVLEKLIFKHPNTQKSKQMPSF